MAQANDHIGGADPVQRDLIQIRLTTPADWPAIWRFYREIVSAGETYALDRAISEDEGREQWLQSPPGVTFVAERRTEQPPVIAGSASAYPNRAGGGAHVASASFMVDPRAGGHGIGRALAEHVLAWAGSEGFAAMQFNAVVETNTGAIKLWKSLGFEIIGTVPQAFDHPAHGRVGLHVMHRFL